MERLEESGIDLVNRTRALVLKARNPDASLAERHEFFAELVGRFQDMAYACAYAVLGDHCLAQDAAQEAFVSAWRNLHQLRLPEAFPGWFRRIVLTECSRLTRGKRPRSTPLDAAARVPSTQADPQAVIEKDELSRAMLAAVERLPRNERMAIVLFYVREHSQRDISAFLGVPLTTVAKRLYSARVRLKGMILRGFKNDLAVHRPSRSAHFAKKVRAGIYDDYIGQYRFERRPDLVVTIRREGERLMSEAAGQRNELFAEGRSRSELRTVEFDGRGKFVRDKKGRVSHLIYYEFGRRMGRAKKIGGRSRPS